MRSHRYIKYLWAFEWEESFDLVNFWGRMSPSNSENLIHENILHKLMNFIKISELYSQFSFFPLYFVQGKTDDHRVKNLLDLN